ncbi:MAG: hypothetical protein GX902_01100 [Lentisphaerae bacterium]|nr:hypothetical protein [Lentisphaerota bacterium]
MRNYVIKQPVFRLYCRCSFALIELLLVIAIMAVLATINPATLLLTLEECFL